jgi:hypothetical protein
MRSESFIIFHLIFFICHFDLVSSQLSVVRGE